MGVYRVANDLKVLAMNQKMCNMASFGAIEEYDNKTTIKYPYVNIDIVNSYIQGYSKKYTFRIYVCDRNKPYVAYNKTEVILDTFLKSVDLDITNYTVNYFRYDFQDDIHGVFADIQVEDKVLTECDTFTLPDEGSYILQENGDLIRIEITPLN